MALSDLQKQNKISTEHADTDRDGACWTDLCLSDESIFIPGKLPAAIIS